MFQAIKERADFIKNSRDKPMDLMVVPVIEMRPMFLEMVGHVPESNVKLF